MMERERQSKGIEHMRALTISREYGSGGGEVAQRVAQRLGWDVVDRQIVTRVAQRIGVSVGEAQAHDEHVEGFVSRLLRSMQLVDPYVIAATQVQPLAAQTEPARYQEALAAVVQAAVIHGKTVIVGRGGQALLSIRRDVLRVRIVAPFSARLAYVMEREGKSQEDASERIHFKDHERGRYLQSVYHMQPNDPLLYDLVLNSAVLDLDQLASLIILALQEKARRLEVSEDQLGPQVGLHPYATQVENDRTHQVF